MRVPSRQPDKPEAAKSGFLDQMWKKMTLGAIVGGVILEVMTKSLSPWAFASFHHYYDRWTCGGHAAQAEADRLSEQTERLVAAKDTARGLALFRDAASRYEHAYKCGYPDAGIRLAVLHCKGLGVPKDALKARQYVLEIESKWDAKRGRAKDVRQVCGFPS